MKRIDRETVQRILDAANIVDVVSDFVALKRRGSNYIGLCPFHNERTPSFSVSPARGICKCFSCGKGGSPLNFIIEHEQMTYNEALRYLAKKYNIEIKEQEVSDEERERESARQTMFAANEFAMRYFEKTLTDTADGRDIGLAYFRHRGISDAAIQRFHLGYSLERGSDFITAAHKAGFSDQTLVDTGLIVRRDDGTFYDRFRSRVIYPVHTISGKVVAFGGRTLRSDKKIAKYVNSPESIIYSKSRELYGLFQAKKSIVAKKKCILVEGYMDVISMSQLGVENVVASSGTSLTEGQIRLIHRFADDVTVIYDSDAAGIKASLRGIDMLLAEGLNIKVVLLPDGDDPDSFAQAHSLTEVEQYIAEHETDFIKFKTDILLRDSANDPMARSKVISDILESISVIPNDIAQSVYLKECSYSLNIAETVLLREITRIKLKRAEEQALKRQRQQARESLGPEITSAPDFDPANEPPLDPHDDAQPTGQPAIVQPVDVEAARLQQRLAADAVFLLPFERDLLRFIMRYGMVQLPICDENGNNHDIFVVDFIYDELNLEKIEFENAHFQEIMLECISYKSDFKADSETTKQRLLEQRSDALQKGQEEIKAQAQTMEQIKAMEAALTDRVDRDYWAEWDCFVENYLLRRLASSPVENTRHISVELCAERYKLSKYHTRYTHIETERDKLCELIPRALFGLKSARLEREIKKLRVQLGAMSTPEQQQAAIKKISELTAARNDISNSLGERVIIPRR